MNRLHSALRASAKVALMGFLVIGALASCSEDDGEGSDFDNWQQRNDDYWTSLYTATHQRVQAGDTSWRIYPLWSLSDSTATKTTDHIIVNVVESGSGTTSPVATDTTLIHYSGRLMPSAHYDNGFNFDSSWKGTFSEATALPIKMAANAGIDGFNTALQLMHKGDHWVIYIPYQAAYGSQASGTGSIPAYSDLVFDVRLVDFYHPGQYYPTPR